MCTTLNFVVLILSLSSGVRLALVEVTVILCSSFLSSPHFSLTAFSVNSLQLLSAVVLHSPPTLSRSLLTQSFHPILGLPHLLVPSTIWASAQVANVSSPNLSACPALFSCFYKPAPSPVVSLLVPSSLSRTCMLG